MDVGDLRGLSDRELLLKERELTQDMILARFSHYTGQLDKTDRLRSLRRDIARVKTVVHQRETDRGLTTGGLAKEVGSLRGEGVAMAKVQERFGRKEQSSE